MCRRAERSLVALGRREKVGDPARRYLNRLSDLLFVAGRRLNRAAGRGDVQWTAQEETLNGRDLKIYNVEALGKPLGQYSHVTRVKANGAPLHRRHARRRARPSTPNAAACSARSRPRSGPPAPAGRTWSQFTTYLVHSQDIPKFMQWRLREFPRMFPDGRYPPNTLLVIDRLVGEQYLIEVQTVAAL